MTKLPIPRPAINPETQPFWDGVAADTLLLKQCRSCAAVIWYPRSICPECGGTDTEWFRASGRGTVYSHTTSRRGGGRYEIDEPYVLAYIELDEGPHVLSNIVGDGALDVQINDPVEAVFEHGTDGSSIYRFVIRQVPK